MQDADVFGIVDVLHAERAADIVSQQAHLVVRQIEVLGQRGAVAGDALGRRVNGEVAVGLVVDRNAGAGLHRHHREAGVGDVQFGDVRGPGECGSDGRSVAGMEIERHVVGDVVVELRRAGPRSLLGIRHRGQRFDIEHDGLGGVARLRHRLCNHEGDGIADEPHLVHHQRGAVGLQHGRAVAALQRHAGGEDAVAGLGEIGAGPHAQHARHGAGGRDVDAADHAVGVGAADDPGVDLPFEIDVVGIGALAADQGVVFLAPHRLADAEFLRCNGVIEGAAVGAVLHGNVRLGRVAGGGGSRKSRSKAVREQIRQSNQLFNGRRNMSRLRFGCTRIPD